MKKIFIIMLILLISVPDVLAFKSYSYNKNGERVYVQITPDIAHKNKSRPRRAYVRQPRKNWEITPAMRARKRTTSQFTHRYN